jgi:hypothetical protein
MTAHWTRRFLIIYSVVATMAFAVLLYLDFERMKSGTFDRIRAHRIDIVEPDGKPRLVLSNRAAYPGSFFNGVEVARPDRRNAAGMLMMNDEGSEDGGFIWGGLSADGQPMSFSHLSFDQYEQDQTISLDASFDHGQRSASIRLNDAPDEPLTPELINEYVRLRAMQDGAAKQQALDAYMKKFPALKRRAALERSSDDSVSLSLSDAQGRVRLRVVVRADGEPGIEFLDAAGHVTQTLPTRLAH